MKINNISIFLDFNFFIIYIEIFVLDVPKYYQNVWCINVDEDIKPEQNSENTKSNIENEVIFNYLVFS